MPTRLAALGCLILFALALSGCTKCGWIWNDRPASCHSDAPVTR